MSSVKLAVKLAAFSSAAVVVLAIATSFFIVRDINQLYDEVMSDMDEFKEYSNNAWDGMLTITLPHEREARHARRNAYGGGGGYQQQQAAYHGGGGYQQGPRGGGGYQQGPVSQATHSVGASQFQSQQGGSQCACGRKPNHCPPGPRKC
jgi:hypothetical protein